MTISARDLRVWRDRLGPLFEAPVPALGDTAAQTIGEALALPSGDDACKHRLDDDLVQRLRQESIDWVKRVLRPAWIDEAALEEMLAVPGSVGGLDAFLAGWRIGEVPVQTVITHRRLHVRTLLPAEAASGRPRIDAAAAMAKAIVQSTDDWPAMEWHLGALGPFTYGYRDVPFVASWRDSCLLVSDGKAAKLSFLKIVQRDGPAHGGSGQRDVSAWFPRPTPGRPE